MRQLETISAAASSASAASCSEATIPVAVPVRLKYSADAAANSHFHLAISLINLIGLSLGKVFRDTAGRLAQTGGPLLFARAGLAGIAHLSKSRRKAGASVNMSGRETPNKPGGTSASIPWFSSDERCNGFSSGGNWMPLIKASSTITAAPVPVCFMNHDSVHEGPVAHADTRANLSGRCVLCVDGRAALYPEYRRAVETFGGNLLIYRSQPQQDAERQPLPALLEQADMVICPVDCVNHHAFFTVKRYCRYSGTPCVLLERSGLSTFRMGIAVLAALTESPVRA